MSKSAIVPNMEFAKFVVFAYRPCVFVKCIFEDWYVVKNWDLENFVQNKPRGPLECQGGYQARPKIHVIRVVFQDQSLYARTSFRGAKTCKIGKKGVFLVI